MGGSACASHDVLSEVSTIHNTGKMEITRMTYVNRSRNRFRTNRFELEGDIPICFNPST